MGNRFTKYIISLWRKTHICVKILMAVAILDVLIQIIEVISLDINVNSGGLETTSAVTFIFSFWGAGGFLLLLIILIPICLIISFIKISEPINVLLTVIAIATLITINSKGRLYRRDKFKFEPGPDTKRCVGLNWQRGNPLKKFGLQLNHLKNDKDFVFTNDWLEQNLKKIWIHYENSHFVLNANLLNKKLSQIPDNVVVVFESNIPYDNGNIGGPNDISTWWHYGRGSLIVFGDGRVEFVKIEDANSLQWQP